MKKIILFKLLFITAISFGQRKYFADKYFEEFAYKKSAELYEGVYKKGDSTAYVLSRIGDSYYNNSDYENAEKWYEKLVNNHQDEVSPEYLFKYSQTLKSNGDVAGSDKWMLKFNEVDVSDSRPKELEGNKDYFVEYSNKKTSYLNIHNISTNTKYSDFGGYIYKDFLYFASAKPFIEGKKERLYRWNDQPFLNIYKAHQQPIEPRNVLDVATAKMVGKVNSQYHESNAIFTKDGSVMYFTRDNYDDKKLRKDKEYVVHLKIYRKEQVDGEWQNLTELPFNSDDYSMGHPALSPDEKTLYVVSDMPNGFGSTDIYKVSVNEDHTQYGVPENLGKTINTEGKEMFPYIGSNNTMYFASNGHLGLGALDVFESKIENNIFSKPVNLGKPINGPLDDFAFVINEELSNGYFSSNREEGKGDDDIYSFMISICKEGINGKVTDKQTGEPIADATVKLVNDTGKVLATAKTLANGDYLFENLDCEKSFTVVGSKEDYRPDQKGANTLDIDEKVIIANLQLESLIQAPVVAAAPTALPQIVIRPIYFDFDKYNIREDAKYELEHIVDVMRNRPGMVIKIESHTDRSYLISRGIAANRIESAIGYGEDRLLNRCNDANSKSCTEEEHQLNRRSYFYIVKGAEDVSVTGQSGE